MRRNVGKKNKARSWELPECPSCSLYECCAGLDNLRDPITENGVIVGYKDGCRHYEKERKE